MTKAQEHYQISYGFLASVAGKLDSIARQLAFAGDMESIRVAGGMLGHAFTLRSSRVTL